jgi:hypothetical protein
MAIIPFCTFLPVLKKTVTQRNQEQTRSPKPSQDHGRRIKTILGQFRNKHARYSDKWGKYIVVTGTPIMSVEEYRKEKPDYLLVLPCHFIEEKVSGERLF